MIWVFTEDMNGRYGCLGSFESEVRAQQVADDYGMDVWVPLKVKLEPNR